MSDLLNKASLVVIPSGYKEDTVYSVVPSDGSGDLSFTRASNGTRVNSAGLVEVCPWNLAGYSQNFSSSGGWNGDPITATLNYGIAPDGTQTSTLLQFNTANEVWQKGIVGQSGNQVIMSLWIKGTAGQTIQIYDGYVDKIITIGSDWTRVYSNGNIATSGNVNINTYGGNARTFEVWGLQVNYGSTAKPYFPTTDRLNVPRLTYQNGGGGCPSLLLEKQSTNLITYSEDFTNAGWTKYNATITGNDSTSPDGTQNADKFVDNTNNDIHALYLGITISSDTTISIYVKAAEYSKFAISNLSDGGDVLFNLSTVAVISTSANFKNAKIESVGNGWYRVSATTNGTSGGKAMGYQLVNDSGAVSFAGTGSKGVYVWGAQYEASSYPTSYISTTSASATRVADACSKTGISSLIGQTEGVLFMDFVAQPTPTAQSHFWIGVAGNEIGLYGNSQFIFYSSGGVSINGGNIVAGTRYKVAFAYKANDYVAYINGTQVGTDTSATVPTTSALYINSYSDFTEIQNKQVNEFVLFPTRLTNAELASLTTI